jgi:hypothetical protein
MLPSQQGHYSEHTEGVGAAFQDDVYYSCLVISTTSLCFTAQRALVSTLTSPIKP